jgi:serine carboxypeptidase-like clade 1
MDASQYSFIDSTNMKLSIVALSFVLAVISVQAAIPGHLIQSLPGYPNGKTLSPQYSGYIEVNATTGDRLHYWFALAESNPSTAPVVAWFNGGPGCSSLDGFFYENGPVRFTGLTDKTGLPTLTDNPNRWNRIANMLYVEAPIGVGFSYNDAQNYQPSDNSTADENFAFFANWFKSYPEYAKNDFYISGESYAGIYVPMVADLIRINNDRGHSNINLKGILVGKLSSFIPSAVTFNS